MPLLEQKKLRTITSRYSLEEIYYGLDGRNIFKRTDRYRPKIILLIIFAILVCFNLFEIIFNILSLTIWKENLVDFSSNKRLLTSFVSLLNIFVTLVLSTITTTKLKIQSYVFY